MDQFESGNFIGDSGIEKDSENRFIITVDAKPTAEHIRYLYKNSDKIQVVSPRNIKEKLKRIDKLVDFKN